MGLKVGVIGTGRLGREHVRILKHLDEVESVGCYDIVEEKCLEVASAFEAKAFPTVTQLIEAVDAISVVVPTTKHAEISILALKKGKDVFLEKPIAASVQEADRILKAAKESDRVLQVGHVERFNGALQASLPFIVSPSFIEVERLSPFSFRGTDVSVVMDLMIHDLDLLLFLVGSWPSEIRAKGAGVLTDGPDIVNVRLEYPGGCVANVTASRVSVEARRKVRIFSPSRYLSIDLIEGRVKHYRKGPLFHSGLAELRESPEEKCLLGISDLLDIDEFSVEDEEPLSKELRSFCRAVSTRSEPPVTGEDGLRALMLATEVLRRIELESVP